MTVLAHEAGEREFPLAHLQVGAPESAEFLDDTSIKVSWREMAPISTKEEPMVGNKVRCWRFEEPICMAMELDGSELSLVVSELAPSETYKLRVLAYNAGGGKMSSPELVIKVKSANGSERHKNNWQQAGLVAWSV